MYYRKLGFNTCTTNTSAVMWMILFVLSRKIFSLFPRQHGLHGFEI